MKLISTLLTEISCHFGPVWTHCHKCFDSGESCQIVTWTITIRNEKCLGIITVYISLTSFSSSMSEWQLNHNTSIHMLYRLLLLVGYSEEGKFQRSNYLIISVLAAPPLPGTKVFKFPVQRWNCCQLILIVGEWSGS